MAERGLEQNDADGDGTGRPQTAPDGDEAGTALPLGLVGLMMLCSSPRAAPGCAALDPAV